MGYTPQLEGYKQLD